MNNYAYPPCNSSLATSCGKFVMASSCGEGKMAALFTEVLSSSVEGELAIDETASTVGLAPNVCVVPGVSVSVQEGEEYVEKFVDHLSGEERAARHFVLEEDADDNDNFVDIMSGITAVGDFESAGWTFCGCSGTCKFFSGDVGRGCCRHISFGYMLVFFLHYPLAFSLQE